MGTLQKFKQESTVATERVFIQFSFDSFKYTKVVYYVFLRRVKKVSKLNCRPKLKPRKKLIKLSKVVTFLAGLFLGSYEVTA